MKKKVGGSTAKGGFLGSEESRKERKEKTKSCGSPPLFFLDEIQVASRSNSSLGRTNGSGTPRGRFTIFFL
jgi:hypothetical protein